MYRFDSFCFCAAAMSYFAQKSMLEFILLHVVVCRVKRCDWFCLVVSCYISCHVYVVRLANKKALCVGSGPAVAHASTKWSPLFATRPVAKSTTAWSASCSPNPETFPGLCMLLLGTLLEARKRKRGLTMSLCGRIYVYSISISFFRIAYVLDMFGHCQNKSVMMKKLVCGQAQFYNSSKRTGKIVEMKWSKTLLPVSLGLEDVVSSWLSSVKKHDQTKHRQTSVILLRCEVPLKKQSLNPI